LDKDKKSLEKNEIKTDLIPEEFKSFAEPELSRVAPALEQQQEIWISCLLGGDDANRSYNESVSLHLTGAFHVSAMVLALQLLSNRHEALRSTFSADGKQIRVFREIPLSFRYEDLSSLNSDQQNEFISTSARQYALETFDLVNGPLFKAALFKLEDEIHYLTINAHQIICDGWSLGIIIKDLSKIYSALSLNNEPSLPPAPSFCDYSLEQLKFSESEEFKKTEQYWMDQYAQVPVVDMPTDFPRPVVRTYKSNHHDFLLKQPLVSGLKKIGAEFDCTLVNMLMTSYEVFLHLVTGQPDIVLGVPVAGQSVTVHYGLVGHCVNLLPVRSFPKGDSSFSEYLKERKSQILNDYEHQRLTFGSLLKKMSINRDASRIPLVPLVFNINLGLGDGVSFEGLKHRIIYNPRGYEFFEIFINLSGSEEALVLEWSYNAQIFKSSTIRRLMEEFEYMLEAVAADPAIKIKDIPLLPPEQMKTRLRNWNATEMDYPKNKTFHKIFSEMATIYSHKTAIRFNDDVRTFKQLNEEANQLAVYLIEQGAKPNDFIGLSLDRSVYMVTALLAIMKTGAAYLPLDPNFPKDRINFMLEDSSTRLILTNEIYKGYFSSSAKELYIEDFRNRIDKFSKEDPEIEADSHSLAYLLYTSGSTGKPKGVMVEHRNLMNFLYSMQKFPGVTSQDKLLAVTTISFDIAGLEIYLPLITGAELVIASDEDQKDGRKLLDLLKKEKITVIQATPATFQLMLEAGWNELLNLKVLCGGEAIPRDLIAKLIPKCKNLYNMYGPTETTIWSTCAQLFSSEEIITIGIPIGNTQVYILDQYGNPLLDGMIGELYIGGDGVSRGYFNRPDLQEEKFLPDHYSKQTGMKMYRTGDLSRFLPDGSIEYMGRSDDQVKIRGYRIELSEIEYVIQQSPEIQQAVVIARDKDPSEKMLIAYVVSKGIFNKEVLTTFIQERLPDYMVPRIFIPLSILPLTENGKLDKKSLPDPDLFYEFGIRKIRKAETENQKMLMTVWKDALHLRQISIDDNFFELGGHSLIAIRIIRTIEQKTNRRLPITTLFESPTIEKLARLLEGDEKRSYWKSLVPIKTTGSKPTLYLIHGSGLTVLVFHNLAMFLDPDRPIFGLQARGLNGIDEPFDNMEDIASGYLAEILEQNPTGPYSLVGYSFGGIVAFEMAKRLKAMGREVIMLAILDANADNSRYFDSPPLRWKKKIKRQFPKFNFIFHSFVKRPIPTIRYQFDFVRYKLHDLLLRLGLVTKELDEEERIEHFGKINSKHEIAYSKYQMRPYNGKIDLFRVKTRNYYLDDPIYLGWKPYAAEIEIHEISGDHKTFLLQPNVQELARLLEEIMKERNAAGEINKSFADASSVSRTI
jgi:amino acid adenylation domain-containing protein